MVCDFYKNEGGCKKCDSLISMERGVVRSRGNPQSSWTALQASSLLPFKRLSSTFTVTITGVTASGYSCNASLKVETSDSITNWERLLQGV